MLCSHLRAGLYDVINQCQKKINKKMTYARHQQRGEILYAAIERQEILVGGI